MDAKPIVHCLVARPVSDLIWGVPQRTSLARAAKLKLRGWIIVGPDPEDMWALTAWEKRQERYAAWPFS